VQRLEAAIYEARQRPTKILVVMGGVNFWSNGFHLNVIEAAPDSALESWNNINAIDDVVLAILTTCDRLTIAALRANTGAGGAMMTLACDRIIVRDGVVLNPHYQAMGLYGSEYWTYSLPKRVGPEKASSSPRIAFRSTPGPRPKYAVIGCDVDAFEAYVTSYAETLAKSEDYSKLLVKKEVQRSRDEAEKPLSLYRHEELSEIRKNFWGMDDAYHVARRNFVHKIFCGKTPLRLAKNRRAEERICQVTS
jgi:putative two-component system protein, hydrogenase maturation factor HypX/HoxX